ncbi:MAG: RHS repeat-associated core domain-containing protein [Bacteroidetes bacterium]|nr:RHS repeat-associated core domain-containing protein [Bacteroidota bacterium]
MKKSLFSAVFALVYSVIPAIAQVGAPGNYEKYEFQPEAFSFPEYKTGDTDPHGNFVTSVPIFSLTAPSGISTSVTFSYNSDIKYADPAGWIGLGWKWNPGTITRSVQGGFMTDPALTPSDVIDDYDNLYQKTPPDFPTNLDSNLWDQYRDIYSVSLPDGRSAKFIITNWELPEDKGYDEFTSLGTESWKIRGYYKKTGVLGKLVQCRRFAGVNNRNNDPYGSVVYDYYAFVIRDENGVQYVFKDPSEELSVGKNGAKSLYYSTWRISWMIDRCVGSWVNPELETLTSSEKSIRFIYGHNFREFVEFPWGDSGHICATELNAGALSHKKYLTSIETANQRITFDFKTDEDCDPTQFQIRWTNKTYDDVEDLDRFPVTRKRISSISFDRKGTGNTWNPDQMVYLTHYSQEMRTYLDQISKIKPTGEPVAMPWVFEYAGRGGYTGTFVFNHFLYHQKGERPYQPFNSQWDINGYYKNSKTLYSNHLEPGRGQLIGISLPNGRKDTIIYNLFKVTLPDQYAVRGLYWQGFWQRKTENTGTFLVDTKTYFGEESYPEIPADLTSLAAIIGVSPSYFAAQLKYVTYFYKPVVAAIKSRDLISPHKIISKIFTFHDPVFKGLPSEMGFEKSAAIKFVPSFQTSQQLPITLPTNARKASRNSAVDDQLWFKSMEVTETGLPNQKTEWSLTGQDQYLVIGPYGASESSASLFTSNHDDIFFEKTKVSDSDGQAVLSRKTFSNRKNAIQYINTMPFTQPPGWKLGGYVSLDTRPKSTVTQDFFDFPKWTLSGMKFTSFDGSVQNGEAIWAGYNAETNKTEFKFSFSRPARTWYTGMTDQNLLQTPGMESDGFLMVTGRIDSSWEFPWLEVEKAVKGQTITSGIEITFLSHKITTYSYSSESGFLPKETWLAKKEKPAAFQGWTQPVVTDEQDWLKLAEVTSYTSFGQPTETKTPFIKEKVFFGNSSNQMVNAPAPDNWYKPTARQILTLTDSIITTFSAKYNPMHQLSWVQHQNLQMTFTYDEAGRPYEVFRNGAKLKQSTYNAIREGDNGNLGSDNWLWAATRLFNSGNPDDWAGAASYYDGFGEIQKVTGSPDLSKVTEPLFDLYFRPAGSFVPYHQPGGLDYLPYISGGGSIRGEYWGVGGLKTAIFSDFSQYVDTESPEFRPGFNLAEIAVLDDDPEAGSSFGYYPYSFTRKSIGGHYSMSWLPGAGVRKANRFKMTQTYRNGDFNYTVTADENKKVMKIVKTDLAGRELESGIAIPVTNPAKLRVNLACYPDSGRTEEAGMVFTGENENVPVLDIDLTPLDVPETNLNAGYDYFRVKPGEVQRIKITSLPAGKTLKYVNHDTKEVIHEFKGPLSDFTTDLFILPGLYEMEVWEALDLPDLVSLGGVSGFVWSYQDAELEQKVSLRYDQYGRVKSVTHPDGTQTQYRYDYFGNILKKETPFHDAKLKSAGLAESDADANPDFEFMYDKYGRLRFSVDPNQSVAGKMTYFKYDYLSRPVEQGQIVSAGNWTAANADNGNWPQITGQNIHPTSVMSKAELDKPAASIVSLGQSHVVQTKIYYDISRTVHGYSLENGLGKPGYKIEYSPNPDGKFRAIRTYYSYTPEGWVKSVTEISDTVTKTEKFKEYDYQGKLKSWEASLSGKLLSKRRFWYDGLSRPVKISQIHAGRTDSVVWTYTYGTNENSVIQTNATGTFNQISIQDVRGWLREINSQSTGFSEELYYFGTGLPAGVQPNYNGNISFIRTVNRDVLDTNPVTCRDTLGFGFDYDNWNRLTGVKTFGVQNTRNDRYNSAYVYDGMGNMTSQIKKTWDQTTKVITELDNLVYQYAGTRLLNVIDKVKTARTDDYETTVNSVSGPSALINQSFAGFTEDFSQYPVAAGARPQSAIWDQTGFYSTDPASGVSIVSESGNLILKLTPQTSASSTTTSASMRTKAQTIIPGRIYTLAGKYKGVAVNSDEIPVQPNAYAGIEWLRQDFTRISVQYVLSTGRATAWTSFTGNLTAPADAVYARAIVMDNAATGTTVYFDNISLSEAGISFKYDNNGNLVQDLNRGISQLTYNSQNLPEKVTKTNGSVVYYGYNFSGQRIWKKVGPDTWVYVRDAAGAILAEYKNSSAAIEYVSLMTAGSETVGQSRLENGTWKRYYWVKDHLGNIRQTFRDDGTVATVVSTEDYYPFGATLKSTTTQLPAQDKFKYQGKERDQETGYDYFEARLYDSQLGRFLQVDPHADRYKSSNPFVGMGDNPIIAVDPTGMDSVQRANLVAAMNSFVENNPGGTYGTNTKIVSSSEVKDGAKTDCSGLVNSAQAEAGNGNQMAGKEGVLSSDGKKIVTNGVALLVDGTEKVDVNKIEAGNYVVFKTNRSNHEGADGEFDHIGVATDIKKDENGNVIGFTVLHSFGKPTDKTSGPQATTYNVSSPKTWLTLKGVYKWDKD